MKTRLQPYTIIDGIPTYSDSAIKGTYDRMEADGSAEIVFCDGTVTNSDEFMKVMKFGNNMLFFIYYDDTKGLINKPVGIVWLNSFEVRRAEFHFCFFKEVWGKKISIEIGKACVVQLLNMKNGNDVFLFDMLTGLVPVFNSYAIEWCKAMGFSFLAEMPCAVWRESRLKNYDGYIYYVLRGQYHG